MDQLAARWKELTDDLTGRGLVICPHGAWTLLASSGPVVHWPQDELPGLLGFAGEAGARIVYAELIDYTEHQLRLLDEDRTSEDLLAQARGHLGQPAFIALAVICEGVPHGWMLKATWYAALLEQREIDQFVSGVEAQERTAGLREEAAAWAERLAKDLGFRRATNPPAREAAALAAFPELQAFLDGLGEHASGGMRGPGVLNPIHLAYYLLPDERRRVAQELSTDLQGLAQQLAATSVFREANTKNWRKRLVRQFLHERAGFSLPELVEPLEEAASAVAPLPRARRAR